MSLTVSDIQALLQAEDFEKITEHIKSGAIKLLPAEKLAKLESREDQLRKTVGKYVELKTLYNEQSENVRILLDTINALLLFVEPASQNPEFLRNYVGFDPKNRKLTIDYNRMFSEVNHTALVNEIASAKVGDMIGGFFGGASKKKKPQDQDKLIFSAIQKHAPNLSKLMGMTNSQALNLIKTADLMEVLKYYNMPVEKWDALFKIMNVGGLPAPKQQ